VTARVSPTSPTGLWFRLNDRAMLQGKSRVHGRRLSHRSKLRLLLTESETERLNATSVQSGASRSLLISEAMRAGLANPNQTFSHVRRSVIVDAWLPTRVVAALKRLAITYHLSQQHLLRLFLFQYLTAAPWEQHPADGEKQVSQQ
jgi:hypothetical protein